MNYLVTKKSANKLTNAEISSGINIEKSDFKNGGLAMTVYLLAGIVLGGLALFIIISLMSIKKSKTEIEKMFK